VKKWRIRDIIDLEYFFHKDAVSQSAEDQQYLHERDRRIFLNSIRPGLIQGETPEPRRVIRAWLNRRRQMEAAEDAVLPGEGFESLYSSFRMLFVLAGIVCGGGAGLSFLTYSGDRPLNIFVYLTVFVFSQLLLLLLLLVLSLYRVKTRSILADSPLYRIISRALLRIVLAVQRGMAAKMGADRRLRAREALGLIMARGSTYGFLFVLPAIILTQLFAIGFNLGLLVTTLFKVTTADIAFGWQSTLQLNPATVYALVQKIALPWSWLGAKVAAYPSLTQVEGSRIILKEGIYHLSTPDLASWWPFLCFSVLFYGLLPRLLFFLGAVAAQHRYLGALTFRQGTCEQLLLRMTTPLMSIRGHSVDSDAALAAKPEPHYGGGDQAAARARNTARDILIMIPDDILTTVSREEIASTLQNRFNAAITRIIRVNKDYETDAAILADLKNSRPPAETDILLIQEAWQPPIAEYINFIKSLRRAVGPGPCLRVGLTGKPRPDTVFTSVQDENRKIWARKITALGDPCIYTVGLVQNVS
jgi:hypothetical protein